jgi:23S rRNA (guanine745-N1)-methyltransferase
VAVRALVGMGPHARHRTSEELSRAIAQLPDRMSVTVSVDVAGYVPA